MDNPEKVPPIDELEGVEQDEANVTLGTAPETAAPVGVVLEEGTGVDDEIDDEADVEGSIQSSVQIAPTGDTSSLGNEDDPMLFIQLGDRVVIDSKKYGRTIGNIYYRSLELIRVKPDGVSNTVHSFELEQTDDEELFNEEDGVTAAYVVEKRKFESFVEQQDFRINQIIDTFDSKGELYKAYKIVKVDKENDYIQIQDLDNEDDINDLNFDFTGISPDEDFTVISIRQLIAPDTNSEGFKENEAEQVLEGEEVETDEAEEVEEEDEIEVVGYVEIVKPKVFREALAFEQKIPDNLQKVDALNDFLSGLDPILQKDAKSIRAVRVLVETLFNLKQATIAYNDDGSVKGTKEISASTLSELIQKASIPLGRPVLEISKKAYQTGSEEEDIEGQIHFERFGVELNQMVEKRSQIVSGEIVGAPKGQIVKEWIDQQNYLKKYASPWSSESSTEPIWRAKTDTEFFRTAAPEFAEIDGTAYFLDVVPGYLASHDVKAPPTFAEIPFGIERALSTTYRKGVDRKKQVLLPEESATMNSYLIFPSKVASSIGTTRSSNVAIDSGRSLMPKDTMRGILEKVGTPREVGTSNDLILLDVNGGTLGNIPLADYIEGISVPALGLGDTFSTLEQYGMDNLELTPEIATVLLKKIELYQEQLLSSISNLRRIIETEAPKTPEENPFIELTTILEVIRSQPTLVDDLQEYERINPSLAASDIGKVAYLMKKHPDYFQVAAGQNSLLIAKALLDSNNAAYLQSLKVANLLKYNKLNAGVKPKRNTCEHVAKLVAIRKIFDDSEKFQKLTEFFKLYQGERDNNWINCNKCKEHLLCIHERLQIQAYLNPKDRQIIEKEIILKFSGGSFQGKYICRNCGQAIRDLDFDNGIEFDDNGKPKSGRAVLVDEDAVFEEKLDIIVSAPIEPSQKKELQLNSSAEEDCYDVVSEIAARVGVALDNTGYKNIINKVISWLSRFPARDDYEEKRKKRPAMPEYDVAVARNLITTCATFLLLNIQAKVPPYPVKYALIGCDSPGFDGYPLDSDTTNKQGIQYIACAVASVRRNQAPWSQTGFQKVADDKKRQIGITIYMDNILKEIVGDDMIQAELSEKRKYLEDIRTKSADFSGPVDKIPATFLPEQIIITPEEAAKDVITPEVVANMGNKGKQALVKLWIRQAHLLAKKTASLVRGSPLSETTCCLTNIEVPGTFWASASDLPKLDRRTLVPNQQGNMLVTEFMPRAAGTDVAEPDKELYYRLFLKYCFQGTRFGYPHEPGLTNQCPWCGFQFPTIPAVMDTDTEGKTALVDVKTDTEEFTKLLDKIHEVNEVKKIESQELMSVTQIMDELGAVAPPPIPGWSEIVKTTTTQFLKLPPDADRGDVATAAGEISEAVASSEQIIYQRLTDETYHRILEEIVNLSWTNFFQVLQAYFIVPFQRIVSQFSPNSLFVPIELEQTLSRDHVTKDIEPILINDTNLVRAKEEALKKPAYNFAKSKLKYFLSQMSALLSIKNEVRPIVIPGRNMTLVYIQRALLYGPLATLLNSAEIPKGTEIDSSVKSLNNPSMKFLLETVASTLNKYRGERLSFNDQEIKDLIAIRNEKERVNVIAEFNKLTDEERAIELTNKRLGLGKWAVGGTKLIYAYDKDYYDLERQKREAAGIVDFPGLGPDQMRPLDGRPVDEYGLPIFNDADFEAEGGYDFNQHADDDYE